MSLPSEKARILKLIFKCEKIAQIEFLKTTDFNKQLELTQVKQDLKTLRQFISDKYPSNYTGYFNKN